MAAVCALVLIGCSSGHAKASAPTTTTVPEALWIGQAKVWLSAHGNDLNAISGAAKDLGDAAKAGSGNLTQTAITQFMVQVGQADGDLPANAFGHDMHPVFVDYVTALQMIRKGLLNNDQGTYRAGSDALAAAVAKFGTLTNRMKATP